MTPFRFLLLVPALAILVGLNFYLYRRLVHDVTERRWARLAGALLIFGVLVAVPATRLLFRDALPARWLSAAVMEWWGLSIFTLLALLAAELVLLVARRLRSTPPLEQTTPSPAPEALSRRRFLARSTAAGALVVGGGVSAYGTWTAFSPPAVTEVPIRLPGLPRALEGFTIVQLSDIHVGPVLQERFVDQLVAVANSARGDLVAITGDLVDGSPSALGRYVARFANLRSRLGTYFVSGNHDYYSGWERWAPKLTGLGFTVLRNRFVTVGEPGASFDLVGVDDWGFGEPSGQYDLDAATRGRDLDRPSVLLAHQPKGLELAAEKRLGLQLSGHTHGGQVFPGNLIGTVIWGTRNAGLSRYEGTHLYTSRGCGFVGPPMRVGAPPEVVKVILLPG
jgi:predicted MPP superfamily phosphohydrolase